MVANNNYGSLDDFNICGVLDGLDDVISMMGLDDGNAHGAHDALNSVFCGFCDGGLNDFEFYSVLNELDDCNVHGNLDDYPRWL